ncbi:MAG: hypothetical protein A2487_06435 [Candidatus Raymondbacteria bacterium RifOxyC12_full_50_8]|uniref:Three-Cys-motif partner protein TcmP n=1 Tax=Candidatus Raymondbacteria bacterium RIFOXYD12_FULL_49_13 TaxID=1817890 RepID=A0A1F7FII1_UNCRA|nr:MAG: hypothetical protein A2248_21150 [Candidatus Raymondbacteria bacterium RIFOXYA2_FULL_49_16]OGJ95699.1 MAG: hypothetical protein A2350_12220 [Candidatus Raymondbacteria bacterium RifOxyB12_full_50_8]OGK05939.1 MAG: hypothetical protein A2487_06435 [Candidatus Raymondbacteria bacterium RifOxyC12_full_50_8]OGK06297.1 MAG: hypothetical protein A2519_08465 [Candidatus Raymondbacteria bacterium RIFOXYD12_FULL_49_13]OGP40629.1 MAG: hypothetical protein A2324_03220 [Candidatus Raymondbacteria b
MKDDGLFTLEMGNWNEDKYALVQNYASIFSTGMKNKWCRVYINLFSGPGRSRFKETGNIVESSALLALKIPDMFDKYIFCDIKPEALYALKKRIENAKIEAIVSFVEGDVNLSTDKILKEIPKHGPNFKVLSFCFIDPYKMDNLTFDTIRKLSAKFMDFLILIPTYMDAHRNPQNYEKTENTCVDRFLGNPNWRLDWIKEKEQGAHFADFIHSAFAKQMQSLKYQEVNTDDASILVRNTQKKAPLYHLSFFSKHKRGHDFFKEAKKYSNPQTNLDLI